MRKSAAERAAYLIALKPRARRALLAKMSIIQQKRLRHYWHLWAHEGQLPPASAWSVWLIQAGRGFGKTRAGAEWVRAVAEADPAARIALVAASLSEARSVMVEAVSGLLAIAPRGKRPKFEPSRRRLVWPSGAQAVLYSAGEPESLRGPQHSHACRPGPERKLRQRNGRAGRYFAAPCDRGRAGSAARLPCRRASLAGRIWRNRRLDRPDRQDRRAPGRKLALCCPARRDEAAPPGDRAGNPLLGRLEGRHAAFSAEHWSGGRQRGPKRHFRHSGRSDHRRNRSRKLSANGQMTQPSWRLASFHPKYRAIRVAHRPFSDIIVTVRSF